MSRLLKSALTAALGSAVLIGSVTNADAGDIERIFGFNHKKTAQKKRPAKNKKTKDSRSFSFFNAFDSREPRTEPRRKVRLAARKKTKTKSLVYHYRPNALVSLGDRRLKQPLNKVVPIFSTRGPKDFDPVSNLVGGDKLDDSLAQTIFDNLKAANMATRVEKNQNKAIVAFYKSHNFKSVWTDMDGVTARGRQMLAYLAQADSEGLNPADYLPVGLTGFSDDLTNIESDLSLLAQFDINLTAMAVRYGQHASGGRIIPNRLSGYHDLKPPKVSAVRILRAVARSNHPEQYLASLHPTHKSYLAFKKALASMTRGTGHKQYPNIRPGGLIKVNQVDDRIPLIRVRLQDRGLLAKPAKGTDLSQVQLDYYDEQMFDAVKKFQKSKRLPADGVIGRRTIAAFNGRKNLNRRNHIVMNMERLRWLPRNFGNKYVFVNQASFYLDVINNNRTVWQTRVVVGKPKNQTSFFIDKMKTVVFNPYWGVPQSIITKEMLPRLQANPGYLDQKGFEVYNSRGRKVSSSSIDWYNYGGSRVPFSIRQPPSGRNALGKIKFLFPNKHAIYMHDTPSKHLFSRSSRAFSHGCVRVKNPSKLAENLLGWSPTRIDQKIAAGKNSAISLKRTIPVYLAYFTAWPDQTGKIRYYSDIYGRDRLIDRALNKLVVASK